MKKSVTHNSKNGFLNSRYPSADGFAFNSSDKVQIWYKIIGNKDQPLVTLIPGSDSSSVYWSNQIIEELIENKFRVLVYDPRDTGKSTWLKWPKSFSASKWNPGMPTPYDFLDHFEDLKQLWKDLDIKQSHIIGVSQGGMIGQIAAIEKPDKVLSLSLLSTSPTNQFDEDLDPLTPEFFEPVEKMLTKVGIQASMQWLLGKKYLKSATNAFMYLLQAREDERNYIYEYFRQIHEWGGYNVKSGQGFAYANQKSRLDDLGKISAPTIILHGDRDNFFSLKHAKALKTGIKNSRLIIITDGLHAIPVEMFHPYLPGLIEHLKNSSDI